jgi:hypothetical protein
MLSRQRNKGGGVVWHGRGANEGMAHASFRVIRPMKLVNASFTVIWPMRSANASMLPTTYKINRLVLSMSPSDEPVAAMSPYTLSIS